jgi:hypothetical protein
MGADEINFKNAIAQSAVPKAIAKLVSAASQKKPHLKR